MRSKISFFERLKEVTSIPRTAVAVQDEPAMTRIVTDMEALAEQALDYEMTNQRVKLLQARMKNVIRPAIEQELKTKGEEDISGHKHLVLPHGVELIHERRSTPTFNTLAAEVMLANKGILEECSSVVTTRVLDEEKIVQAYEAGLISPQEYETLWTKAESWALKVKIDEALNPEYELLTKIRKSEEKVKLEMPTIEME